MFISLPGQKSGRTCAQPVELLDLYPTLAGAAGLAPPTDLHGVNLMPILTAAGTAGRGLAFSQVQRGGNPGSYGIGGLTGPVLGHSVRSSRWRLTLWGEGAAGEELYDEESDPTEQTNLAGDPTHRDIKEQLRAELRAVHPVPVKPLVGAEAMREKYSD